MRLELAIVALKFISGDLYFQWLEDRSGRLTQIPLRIQVLVVAMAL